MAAASRLRAGLLGASIASASSPPLKVPPCSGLAPSLLPQDARYVHDTLFTEFGIATIGQRLRIIEELHRLFN